MQRHVFITGGTGYIGSRLIPALLARGHRVAALTRAGSRHRLPAECRAMVGDALESDSFRNRIEGADTLVHLVGVPHPNPSKAEAFLRVDLPSALASLDAARHAGVRHFIYLSVARPAPVMQAYATARARAETAIRAGGIDATFVRPWYVLGPGHRWPLLLQPAYRLLALFPATRGMAQRLGLVTLDEMVRALVWCVEHPAQGISIVDVPGIRALGQESATAA